MASQIHRDPILEYHSLRVFVRQLSIQKGINVTDQNTSNLLDKLQAHVTGKSRLALSIILAFRNSYVHDSTGSRTPSPSDLLFAVKKLSQYEVTTENLFITWLVKYIELLPQSGFPYLFSSNNIEKVDTIENLWKEYNKDIINRYIVLSDGKYAYSHGKYSIVREL